MEIANPPADVPYLPEPEVGMNWRSLNRFSAEERGADFYLTCLRYGQALWRQRLPARAILCLDRAWGADLSEGDAALAQWPMPYAALSHILKHAPSDAFLGNPRVHFQHYADRLGEPRREQRKWRAWACWEITRCARPEFPGDPKHSVEEPQRKLIAQKLDRYGHAEERALWEGVLRELP